MAKARRTVLNANSEEVPMSLDEDKLEDLREKVQKGKPSARDLKAYKEQQVKVAQARTKAREDEGRTGVGVVATEGG